MSPFALQSLLNLLRHKRKYSVKIKNYLKTNEFRDGRISNGREYLNIYCKKIRKYRYIKIKNKKCL